MRAIARGGVVIDLLTAKTPHPAATASDLSPKAGEVGRDG
jgi:hypothetical protein